MTVVLVCGGHVGIDPVKVCTWLVDHCVEFGPVRRVIEGGATGADRGGRMFAAALGIECVTVEAEWERYGHRAGPIRNRAMLMEHIPGLVIAFPGKAGTRNMIAVARSCGVRVIQPTGNFFLEGRQ